MLRFVALAILAGLLFLLVRASIYAFLAGLRGPRRAEMRGRPGVDELVKDPVCETYIPRRKAIARGSGPAIQYFCSVACADKHAAHS